MPSDAFSTPETKAAASKFPPEELIPIVIKKKFNRKTFPGRPKLESYQHMAMEQGRVAERCLGDAIFAVRAAKKDMMEKIKTYTSLNLLAKDGKFPDKIRPIKFAADIIKFMKIIRDYTKEVQEIMRAYQGMIGFAQMQKQLTQMYLQGILNDISTLIKEICNLNLPDLPSIPNIFADLHFDGFAFPRGAFKFSIHFDTKFTFSQCGIRLPNTDIFRNYRKPSKADLGELPFSSPVMIPPLPGATWADASRLGDSTYALSLLDINDVPYFIPRYATVGAFKGAFPDPSMIVSGYELPNSLYKDNFLSLLPTAPIIDLNPPSSDFGPQATKLDSNGNVVTENGKPVYVSLTSTENLDQARERLQEDVRSFLVNEVTLEEVADAIQTADWWQVLIPWVTYVAKCREARSGVWIKEYDDLFTSVVKPIYDWASTVKIEWHSSLLDPTVTIASPVGGKPESLVAPLTDALTLWKLSYIEAALLGYKRSTRWDSKALATWFNESTGDALDFQGTVTVDEGMMQLTLDSEGLANYPTKINVPNNHLDTLRQALTLAGTYIKNAPSFSAADHGYAGLVYVYDERANAITIDKYSQFWRVVQRRLENVLHYAKAQNAPYLYELVLTHPKLLQAAINPLVDQKDFERLKLDYINRNWTWRPGLSLWGDGVKYLPTPFIPLLTVEPSIFEGNELATGWDVNGSYVPTESEEPAGTYTVPRFDKAAFLAREDIKSLPLNVRESLLFYNQAYADVAQIKAEREAMYDDVIKTSQREMNELMEEMDAILSSDFDLPAAGGTEADYKAQFKAIMDDIKSGISTPLPTDPVPLPDEPVTPDDGKITVDQLPDEVLLEGEIGTKVPPLLSGKIPLAYLPPSGGSGTIPEHVQSTPSDTWVFNHGLGRYPDVSVFLTDGRQIYPDIVYVNENTVRIEFSKPQTGRARAD